MFKINRTIYIPKFLLTIDRTNFILLHVIEIFKSKLPLPIASPWWYKQASLWWSKQNKIIV